MKFFIYSMLAFYIVLSLLGDVEAKRRPSKRPQEVKPVSEGQSDVPRCNSGLAAVVCKFFASFEGKIF
jgi:hypothetical protein